MDERVLKSLILPIDDGQGNVDDVKYLIPQGTVTEADLEEAEGKKADAIVRSASGDIASYDDGGDLPMKSLKVNIVPKQSGTGDPSPSNVRAISGTDTVEVYKTNVNVWDEVWELGLIDTATGENEASNDFIRSKNYIPILPSTQYYMKVPVGDAPLFFYDKDKNYITPYFGGASGVFTTPSNAYYMRFRLGSNYGATYNNDVSINYPSTDHDYHAYNEQSEIKSITLPQTVYGGVLDVVRGKLTITWFEKTFTGASDEYWVNSGGGQYYSHAVNSIPFAIGQGPNYGKGSHFRYGIANEWMAGVNNNTGHYILFYKSKVDPLLTISSMEEFIAYLNAQYQNGTPVQCAFELATPIEIDLTPTEVKSLLGDNNVWSDSGSVEVEYRADTSLVINKILEALA